MPTTPRRHASFVSCYRTSGYGINPFEFSRPEDAPGSKIPAYSDKSRQAPEIKICKKYHKIFFRLTTGL
jgi:hypothetical protein